MYVLKFIILTYFVLYCECKNKKPQSCKQMKGSLGNSLGKFIICSVEHSVPVEVCLECREEFDFMESNYKTFIEKCKNDYIDKDRLNVVETTYHNVLNIWEKGFCSECYNNGTITDDVNQMTEKFISFQNCIEKNSDSLCDQCHMLYVELNHFYNQYAVKHSNKICFDLQDEMNNTRSNWSQSCCPRKANLLGFSIVSSVLTLLPLIFYGTAIIYKKRHERSQLLDSENDENVKTDENNAGTWAASNSEADLSRHQHSDVANDLESRNEPGPSSTEDQTLPVTKEINLLNLNDEAESIILT